MRPALPALVLTASLAAAGNVRADPADRGRRLLDAGKYAQALTALTAAQQQVGDGDYTLSCEIGLAHHRLGDPARAHLFLSLCLDQLPDHPRAAVALRVRAEVAATLSAGDFAPLYIVTDPADALAYVATLDPVAFPTPRLVWLPVGSHTVGARAPDHYEAARQVILYGRDPATVEIDLDPIAAEPDRVVASVDFVDDAAAEVTTSDDLPEVEHETLMPERFRRGGVSSHPERARLSRLSLGVEVGMSRSQLAGDDPDDSARLGATATLRIAYRIGGGLGLGSGLGFAMRGTEAAEIDYLTIPLVASYRHPVGPIELVATLGGELAVAITGEFDGASVSTFDLAGVAGIGVRAPIGRRALALGVRYHLGFTTVDNTAPTTAARNRSLLLAAGMWF